MVSLCMGVVNITPDSFSDGGSLPDFRSFLIKIENLIKAGASIIDIGAQSTAPNANPISQEEEIERFKKFLIPALKSWDKDITISIDTFRPEVFKWLYFENPKLDWIFNDVSGHPDFEILNLCENARMVIGHNLCPTREEAPNHLKYTPSPDENLLDHMEKFFKSKKLSNRVIIDPLFGFSKNLEQNMELLIELPNFIKRFPLGQEFLIGISKKSFLRKFLPKSDNPMIDSEFLHLIYLSQYLKELKNHPLILRVHDPKIFNLAQIGATIIENTSPKGYISNGKESL